MYSGFGFSLYHAATHAPEQKKWSGRLQSKLIPQRLQYLKSPIRNRLSNRYVTINASVTTTLLRVKGEKVRNRMLCSKRYVTNEKIRNEFSRGGFWLRIFFSPSILLRTFLYKARYVSLCHLSLRTFRGDNQYIFSEKNHVYNWRFFLCLSRSRSANFGTPKLV